jgi:hypothetical protein
MPYNIPKYSQKDSHREMMKKMLHGKSPYQSLDKQIHYLSNLQKELDGMQTLRNYRANIEKKLQHQRKVNNYIEHHRIMGMLANPRMEPGSRENLIRKREKLEKLGAHISN